MPPVLDDLIPTLLVSLVLFFVSTVLSTFVLAPIYRLYRARYAQYLPLDTLSSRTSSIRDRITRFIAARRQRLLFGTRDLEAGDDLEDLESEDGEELVIVEDSAMAAAMRAQGRVGLDEMRRLSRDLEEGFRDESEDEDEDERAPGRG